MAVCIWATCVAQSEPCIASAIAHDPAASLPAQMPDEATLEATYRFLQTPDVTYEQLIEPHVEQTRAEAGKQQQVLLIQDTTEVDYQQPPTTTGLGPIGNGTHHGYLLQSVLAVVPKSREVLGLMHQEPFLRQPAPKGETKRQREQRGVAGVGTQCAGHRPTCRGGAVDPRGRSLQ